MSICMIDDNSVVFTSQGVMHCGLLSNKKYNLIIISPFEYNNVKILNNICNQIIELYSNSLIDSDNLVIRLKCQDSSRINEFKPLYDILNTKGYKQIEFVNKNLHYNPIIENMLKEQKASLCLKMDYGEKLNDISLRNLRTYLEQAKIKENINVHCVIKDVNSADDKGVQDFVKSMYMIGINKIGLRLDGKYLDENISCTFPESLNRVFINFFKTAKKYSFFIDVRNKEQNELLRKLCKVKSHKNLSLIEKIKNFIFRREVDNEI